MYQQAKRLEVTRKSRDFSVYDVTVKQASSLLAAINALSLLDKRQAWLATPLPPALHKRVSCVVLLLAYVN